MKEDTYQDMMKKLCIISAYYPSEHDPHYAFVGTLISAIADKGIECHVVSPVSVFERKHKAVSRVETTENGAKIYVHCPKYFSLPSKNRIRLTFWLSALFKRRAIKRTFDSEIKDCDAIYSHFVGSGIHAGWLSEQTGIPAFTAIGESNIKNSKLSYTLFRNDLHKHIRGVISVSSELAKEARQIGIFSEQTPIEVFPNSINTDLFKPLDRERCRSKLGINADDFVVSFVGAFIKRKGFDYLQEAIARHPEWKCILIGAGELAVSLPTEQVAFSGRIPHDQIPEYICASDVFALPTQAEGCCNAIVEAMGCGLPIVSSDRGFNYDILSNENAILVNPDSVDEIEQALKTYAADPKLRATHAKNSLQTGRSLSIGERAKSIINFMESNL
ncbi:MAG: glycosyltransferase [Clostridia bacterium]|nr:glycosyltransferase [Clostridia bacterium]